MHTAHTELMIHTVHTVHTAHTELTVHTEHTAHTVHTVHTAHTVHKVHTVHTVHTVNTVHTVHIAHTAHGVRVYTYRTYNTTHYMQSEYCTNLGFHKMSAVLATPDQLRGRVGAPPCSPLRPRVNCALRSTPRCSDCKLELTRWDTRNKVRTHNTQHSRSTRTTKNTSRHLSSKWCNVCRFISIL